MTMKTKKTLQHIVAVTVVLLAFSLVFMMPVSADKVYYASPDGTGDGSASASPGSLSDILTTLTTQHTAGTYAVMLLDGTYSGTYDVIVGGSGITISIEPGDNQKNVEITGTLQPKYGSSSHVNSEIIVRNLNFSLTSAGKSVYIPKTSNSVNLTVDSCNFKGTYDVNTYTATSAQYGITTHSDSYANAGNLKVINSKFTSLSHPLSGHYSTANNEIKISGCTFTNVKSGINIQNAQCVQKVTISENTISAIEYCVRVGHNTAVLPEVIIADNKLTVGLSSDTADAAVVIRGNSIQSLDFSENTVSGADGAKLLSLVNADATNDKLDFSTNTWNDVESDYPSSEDCNLGTAIDFFGAGTADDPYRLSSKADLKKLAEKVNAGEGYSGKYFKLTASVDLNNEEWTPIGNTKATPFRGYFNGDSYTISNLKINAPEQVGAGLFGYVNGSKTLENLNLLNVDISAKSAVGSFVGSTINSYTFKNIHADNVTISGNYKVGGLVGDGYFKAIDCSVGYATSSNKNYVTGIYSAANFEGDCVGGFVGFLGEGAYDALTNCAVYNTEVTGTRKVGGLVGSAFHNNKLVGVSVADITVSTNADASYAEDNPKTMGVGGLVGLFTLHTDKAGEIVGSATITDTSIENVKLVDTNNVGASMGYVTGGQRGSETVDAPSSELFDTVEIAVSGTNTGATTTHLVPPAPVVETPPSSSSSGSSTPGAYYNYPRTVTDGGLVEFGTSKVVKSVTLPKGTSGAVVLNIDSIDYWPLTLDSEFTFDISVENLGEGTSYISFKIDESKLTALELTAADVGVYHEVNGEWVKLVVTYTIEDGDVIYTAETDSFSPFKLVIEEGAAVQKEEVTPSEPVTPPVEAPDVPDEPAGDLPTDIPETPEQPEEPASPAPVLAVLAALGAAVVLRRK